MNRRSHHLLAITEETVICISIFKWLILATGVGILVGSATAGFLKLLDISISSTHSVPYYFLLLPIAMMLNTLITRYVSPDSKGHGTEKVIEAVHKRHGKIRARVVPVKILTTLMTIATGGSVGKEGPCAQIGAALSSTVSDFLKFSKQDRKKLVICGISAGFAAVFGTPIAGAIFGVEVLFVGALMYEILLPSFVAGMVGYHVAKAWGIHFAHPALNFVDSFSPIFFLKVVLGGFFFGLIALGFIELMRVTEKFAKSIRLSDPIKALLGGTVLVGLALLFSTQFLGLGLETIDAVFEGHKIIWYAFLLKALMTSITLSFGGSGGVVTPILFVGATAGAVFAQVMGLDPTVFGAIGLVSLLAGAANTPLAAIILAVELFGSAIAPYATVACVVSFLMSGHRSLYHSQILAMNKAPSIQADPGSDVDHSKTHFRYGTRKIMVKGMSLRRYIGTKTMMITGLLSSLLMR